MQLPLTNKSLGQHWLQDQSILEAIIDAGEVQPHDVVLEIGPGPGTLTKPLCERVDHVVAVEFDQQLANTLEQRVQAKNLSVVSQDILTFDFSTLPADYVVVANIPYYLTSNLIRVLSETPNRAKRVVLLIQKEVAERVCAAPGDMSLLSVSAQFYWEATLDIVVPAHLFTPPPKVDSQVLVLNRREVPLFDVSTKDYFRIVKAGFSERRKMLRSSLSGGLHISKQEADALLEKAGIDGSLRAQSLTLQQWYDLYTAHNT